MSPIFWFACSICVSAIAGAALRARYWFKGAPRRSASAIAMLRIPRRYLKDVHDVVAHDPASAYMHACLAGGVVVAIPLMLLVHGAMPSRVLAIALLACLGICAVGLILLVRRRISTSTRLSRGAFSRLPWALSAFIIVCAYGTIPMLGTSAGISWTSLPGAVMLVIGAVATLDLSLAFGAGPLKHAVTGALHLGVHPRAERFDVPLATAVRPIDLEGPRLGVDTTRDLSWDRIVSLDACVECGRCEAACPAFAAGAPLNPKALVQSLARDAIEPWSFAYAGNPNPGSARLQVRAAATTSIVGDAAVVAPDTLWACTTCRACVHECPMLIEHVDLITDLRRFQALERGAVPAAAARTLRNLRHTDHVNARSEQERLLWMNDLPVRILSRGDSCDVLLWVGASAHEPRGRQALRAFVALLVHAGVDFAILGGKERDSGDVARRLGDEDTFQRLARDNMQTLAEVEFNRVVTADPHALHCLKNEYAQLGGGYTLSHHSELLLELLRAGKLVPRAAEDASVTYHDPCYLARYNGIVDAPRALLALLSVKVAEMQRSGMTARCCGGGGGVPLTNVPSERRIADMRMSDARVTQAKKLIVGCPGCMTMLDAVPQPSPVVQDIAEIVYGAVLR